MRRRRVLVTGGTGLLGKALLQGADPAWEVWATFHRNPAPVEWRGRFHPLDLTDPKGVDSLFQQIRPEIVIHTASIGSVDEAERDPEAARRINVDGTRRIGQACLRIGARLVFISSNAVFDGRHPPYSEEDPVCPINRYGALKVEAERWLRQSGLEALVVRPILIYGWPFPGGRENVVTRWVASLERGRSIRVARDIMSMPLWAPSCADAIWRAVRNGLSGILHVAGPDRIRLDEFARETARLFGLDPALVVPVLHRELELPAPRPVDTSFVTGRMQAELGITLPGIREGLLQMLHTRVLVH